MMRIFLIGILCSLLCIGAQAQSQHGKWTISGKVFDAKTGEAVEYANVLLYNAGDSVLASYATTVAGGSFTVEQDKPGNYYLVIGSLGYEKKELSLSPLAQSLRKIALGDIQLKPSQLELAEVAVVGRKRQVVYKLDKRVIETSGFISAVGGTAVDILAQTPSIGIDAEGEVTFRGSTGFKVYIDGKPSSLGGTIALEQIPAGQIENVEIITTPSARNDADGAVGIININTKKQHIEGWSGMVNLMGSTALSRNVDFLIALRQKDIQWQLSGEASRRYLNSDFDQLKTVTTPELITTDHSIGNRERHTDMYFLRSGLDWYNGNTTWTAALEGGYRDRWRGGALHYEDTYQVPGEAITTASYNGDDYVNLYEWHVRGDAGFDHRFAKPGHKLTGAVYALYEGNAMEYFETNLYNMSGKREQGHKAWEYEYRFTAQANIDYILPLHEPEDKLEAGYQYFSYTEDGDYKIDMYDREAGDFVRRDDLYNKYLFRRDVHAVYAMLSNTWSQLSYQLGLRGEYTYRHLGNNEEWAQHTWHTFGLFPSVHLALPLSGGRTTLAYSRRITQPQLFYMEPYVVYVDYYTAQRGNPFILPEYTNSVEWGYDKSIGSNIYRGGLFFRARQDKIERVRIPYDTGITLDSMANVGNDYALGAELATTLQLRKWWNLDANGSFYHYLIKNEYKVNGKDEKSWNWQLAVNNNFDPAKNMRIRLEARYVGPSVSTQGRVDDYFYMNLTVRQQLLNRKLTASLLVHDLLGTAKYTNTLSNLNVESFTRINPQAPVVTLTLSYTFNNFKSQKKEESTQDLFEGINR